MKLSQLKNIIKEVIANERKKVDDKKVLTCCCDWPVSGPTYITRKGFDSCNDCCSSITGPSDGCAEMQDPDYELTKKR